jgi:hypothetical protein
MWALLWALMGSSMVWWLKSLGRILVIASVGLIFLFILCYVSFLAGWWLPLVPAGLCWSLAIVAFMIMTRQRLKRIQLQQTVQQLVTIAQEKPAVGQIALEYLQQTESEENQTLISNLLGKQSNQFPSNSSYSS